MVATAATVFVVGAQGAAPPFNLEIDPVPGGAFVAFSVPSPPFGTNEFYTTVTATPGGASAQLCRWQDGACAPCRATVAVDVIHVLRR